MLLIATIIAIIAFPLLFQRPSEMLIKARYDRPSNGGITEEEAMDAAQLVIRRAVGKDASPIEDSRANTYGERYLVRNVSSLSRGFIAFKSGRQRFVVQLQAKDQVLECEVWRLRN